jgi:hypothetical protein
LGAGEAAKNNTAPQQRLNINVHEIKISRYVKYGQYCSW